MTERRVRVYDGKAALANAVAARFIKRLVETLAEQDRAHVVLTGGTMGEAVLAAVRESARRDTVDWSRVTFWWGDERYLPAGDPDRNETQSRHALLDALELSPAQVKAFPALGEHADIEAAAEAYAAELAAAAPAGATHPRFDITFLGVGGDGHIASLFPDHEAIRDTQHVVLAETNSPKPPPARLTLTLPVINSSERVWLVLAGADKAGALGLALADANPHDVPVAGVSGRARTVFFVDAEAAAEVPENLLTRERFWTAAHEIPAN
ncbi:6-phosphogluconolactonase [Protaetiibacter intestinalis]|uniref:6-phosphogluconolactonase n=1 Tax=Protaetiibacter intestinalis TaxID=2419774 RepID=A0A387BBI9_9MICO|nr:6-phosphogluconolactonase [Protaetiibacter intestinalis]AYF99058.1 6-phosphogluconolactonase [Protaetiibacter intestinalis]